MRVWQMIFSIGVSTESCEKCPSVIGSIGACSLKKTLRWQTWPLFFSPFHEGLDTGSAREKPVAPIPFRVH